MNLSIVIPAYNEEKVIGDVLTALPRRLDGIKSIRPIVVDDGSTDLTGEIAQKCGATTLRHVINMGVGAATITGMEGAKKLRSDITVTLDADGQHNPENIYNLITPILNHRADVTIGTRMFNTRHMPAIKVMGNWTMNALTWLVYQQWVADSQSGMRAYSKKALRRFKLEAIGYEICSEVIGEIKRNHLSFIEVPIETIYTDYSQLKGQDIFNGINIATRLLYFKLMGIK